MTGRKLYEIDFYYGVTFKNYSSVIFNVTLTIYEFTCVNADSKTILRVWCIKSVECLVSDETPKFTILHEGDISVTNVPSGPPADGF